MSSYLMSAPPMMICGINTSGTMLAAVFGSATSEETTSPKSDAAHRRHENNAEIDPEHAANLQNPIA